MVPNWVYFGQGKDFKLITELSQKVQYYRRQAIKNGLKGLSHGILSYFEHRQNYR